ncbi:hypothetical protein G9A89_019090 [Geosiphon pyriformis]|nr:hypothetical protein G9A89_019090 [Geosiphon pyriformis]
MFQIRPQFCYDKVINWFPGHMAKGIRVIGERLLSVDMIVELPINIKFEELAATKDRLIVYNKADLADVACKQNIINAFQKYLPNQKVMFTSANVDRNVHNIIKVASEKARSDPIQYSSFNVMVFGMPNVGKSTLINSMRSIGVGKGKAARTGANPGITRSVSQTIKVVENPPVYIIDTPGVMIPHIHDPISSLKVALTGGIIDHAVDVEIMADYLLWRLNTFGRFKAYMERFDMSEPTDDINVLLPAICKRIGALKKGGLLDRHHGANFFIKQYRLGKFGRYTLDDVTKEGIDKHFTTVIEPVLSKHQVRKLEKAKKDEKRLEKWRKMGYGPKKIKKKVW